MITKEMQIRPRYGEVDQMGYVYHANYVSYCHQARTELFRSLKICDNTLEKEQIMIPVIDFHIDYKNPAHYDELLTIKTSIKEATPIKCSFEFNICNETNETICLAHSTVVFVDSKTRRPKRATQIIKEALLG